MSFTAAFLTCSLRRERETSRATTIGQRSCSSSSGGEATGLRSAVHFGCRPDSVCRVSLAVSALSSVVMSRTRAEFRRHAALSGPAAAEAVTVGWTQLENLTAQAEHMRSILQQDMLVHRGGMVEWRRDEEARRRQEEREQKEREESKRKLQELRRQQRRLVQQQRAAAQAQQAGSAPPPQELGEKREIG